MPKRPLPTAACAVLSMFLLGACAAATAPESPTVTAAAVPAPPEAAEPAEAGDFQLSLRRGPCFGRCPQYSLRLDGRGRVEFSGERHVAAPGEHRGRADAAALAELIATLRGPELARLKDIYRPGQSGCGTMATDMPSVQLDWTLDGRSRQIEFYQGCSGAPAALRQLPALVDEVAGSRRWVEQGLDR